MSEAKRYWADIGMSQDDQADNPNENVFTLMVKAKDYDALRAEVERLLGMMRRRRVQLLAGGK